jgi:hypothetical protein
MAYVLASTDGPTDPGSLVAPAGKATLVVGAALLLLVLRTQRPRRRRRTA